MGWDWVDNGYQGDDVKFGSRSCGNFSIPLTEEEVKKLGVETVIYTEEFTKGDNVKIIDGGFSGCTGVVEEVFSDIKRLKVLVSMFGRETPVEVAFEQVTPVK
jgi:transcriptional antiterminator NusG